MTEFTIIKGEINFHFYDCFPKMMNKVFSQIDAMTSGPIWMWQDGTMQLLSVIDLDKSKNQSDWLLVSPLSDIVCYHFCSGLINSAKEDYASTQCNRKTGQLPTIQYS